MTFILYKFSPISLNIFSDHGSIGSTCSLTQIGILLVQDFEDKRSTPNTIIPIKFSSNSLQNEMLIQSILYLRD
jgi:hypothetical protein